MSVAARGAVSLTNEYKVLSEAQLQKEVEKCLNCHEKPCKDKCPVDCSPADFILAVRSGKDSDYKRAAGQIMEMNPLGGVCGVVCPDEHCMSACARSGIDVPVDIPAVQASIVNIARERGLFPKFKSPEEMNGKKIAVIGSGPSGLGATSVLASLGYEVCMYEKKDKLGGDIQLIPSFRLPEKTVQADIEFVTSMKGVTFKTGTEITDFKALLTEVGEFSRQIFSSRMLDFVFRPFSAYNSFLCAILNES